MSHHTIPAIVLISTAIDAIAAATVLAWGVSGRGGHTDRTIDARLVGRAAAASSVVFLLKFVLLGLVGLGRFGTIHLVYADLTMLVPTIGLALLLASIGPARKRAVRLTRPVRIVALLALGLAPIGVYATWIEPFRLQLETAQVRLRATREGSEPLRIGVLTDLQTNHVTAYEHGAVARLMALKPDLILMPGDLFQGSPDDFQSEREPLRELLSRLSAPGGVYFVLGDTDRHGSAFVALLHSAGIRLLVNEIVTVSLKGRMVTIGGIQLQVASPGARALVSELETTPGDRDIRILVAHRPDVVFGLSPSSRIDLVVAGHTHGGQVVIPGFGPPMTLSEVPRKVAAGGLHTLDGNPIYVSRGVGCERGEAPRIRFLCPPEVSLLELIGPHRP